MSAVMTQTVPTSASPKSPPPLVFECTLKGCDVALVVKTSGEVENGVHAWTHLVAETLIKPKIRRGSAFELRPVTISYSVGEFSRSYLSRWTWGNETEINLWISGTTFKIRTEDESRLVEFLCALGIRIDSHSGDAP